MKLSQVLAINIGTPKPPQKETIHPIEKAWKHLISHPDIGNIYTKDMNVELYPKGSVTVAELMDRLHNHMKLINPKQIRSNPNSSSGYGKNGSGIDLDNSGQYITAGHRDTNVPLPSDLGKYSIDMLPPNKKGEFHPVALAKGQLGGVYARELQRRLEQRLTEYPPADLSKADKTHLYNYTMSPGASNSRWLDDNPSMEDLSLNEALKRHTLPEDMTLYRGIRTDHGQQITPGSVIKKHGFMSTSIAPSVAKTFATGGHVTHMLHIKAPKGTSGVPLSDNMSHNHHEKEVLFPAGTRLKHHRTEVVHHPGKGATYVHYMSVVPPKSRIKHTVESNG